MNTKLFQTLKREEKGTFVVLMSLCLLGVFGFAALSIDIGHVLQQKRDMQSAADFAALAGAALLTNQPISTAAIIQTAQDVALSNGLTVAEITANGGTIEVGTWDTNSTPAFTVNGNTNTWNAVRVPAQRTVGLFFGKMAVGPGNGLSAMNPSVHSVSAVTGAGSAFGGNGAGVVPFVLYPAQASNAYYTTYSFDKGSVGSGNFGAADFGDGGSFDDDMKTGCNCSVSVGEFVGSNPGNDGLYQGWLDRYNSNPYVVIPISDPHGSGNSNHGEVITGFVYAKIKSVAGNNGSWTVTLENIPNTTIGGGGGGTGLPYAQVRVLVQ